MQQYFLKLILPSVGTNEPAEHSSFNKLRACADDGENFFHLFVFGFSHYTLALYYSLFTIHYSLLTLHSSLRHSVAQVSSFALSHAPTLTFYPLFKFRRLAFKTFLS